MICGFQRSALVNDYAHITISTQENALAQPGQYIIINDTHPCYVMGNTQGIEIIANPLVAKFLAHEKSVKISPLQGMALEAPEKSTFCLLIAEDDAISAAIFFLKKYRKQFQGLVLLGCASKFPFAPCPSRIIIPHLPPEIFAAVPLLEDWGVPNRLASLSDMPGVYHGSIQTLADNWLLHYAPNAIQRIIIHSLSL
ncbi:MAG: hypothetical protein JSR17_00925 [Proteobacteria bacterium]|nr:hypothetical protein [Pseudomonadota bacterium]